MHRFDGEGTAATKRDFDGDPCDDLASLRATRQKMDARIIRIVAGETDETLRRKITFTTVHGPARVTQKLAPALAHLFNHRTHHRGQRHQMLSAAGRDAPPIALRVFSKKIPVIAPKVGWLAPVKRFMFK